MKFLFKNYLKLGILFFGISFYFVSCQKQVLNEDLEDQNMVFKKITQTDIQFNIPVNKFISNFNKAKKEKSVTGKSTSDLDFEIITSHGRYIETEHQISYTFPIKRNTSSNSNKLENLVLISYDSGVNFNATIIGYDFTYNQFKFFSKEELESRVITYNTIDLGDIQINSKGMKGNTSAKSFGCTEEWTYQEIDPGDEGNLVGAGNEEEPQFGWVMTSFSCSSGGGGSTGGSDGTSGGTGGSSTGGDGEGTSGGGDGSGSGSTGGTSGGDHTSPVDTCEEGDVNCESDDIVVDITDCITDLTRDQISFLYSYPKNIEIRSFLRLNKCSQEAEEFIKIAIIDLMLNKKVDIEESFASPFNVDLELVRPTILNPEQEKVKFMCIYNKLIKSPKFKKLFIDTFGESENLHVKFKIVDNISPIPPSTNEPNGVTKTRLSVNPETGKIKGYNSVIEINKSKMGVSSISLAKTILHESIHAYLTVKQYGCNQGTPLSGFDDVELSELLNIYFSTACPAQSDHEFMFDYLLPTMSEILADIKDDLIPLAHQQSAETETFIDESNPTGPEVPWDWDQFYEYFSMAGLQNSNAFINSILNTPSKLSNHEHYKRTGIEGFSKGCNE